ncbi:SusC/RagA family TonB-linked outer membrane protein [Rudanella paleaurantiibacter]|uniref:SusC/RagA family TonB-linked outer membrane protein n=1 Tax=Rudanella paleaurantiibacter TaxID=2614655 RepID=A0A7J5U5N6_9BACT|nr:SusC/RagA family TonB-linked outer membrane protein [Rudanella paleaurantiibacter]KAB7733162.1 SusC/RagA family TonB-linked outer membrane protein [Rudanella paleaurantiibacter]
MKTFINPLLGLLLLSSTGVLAQSKATLSGSFSGVVTGSDGKPLPGAVVAVQEVRAQTVTDAEGRFAINAALGDVLVIQKKGYLAQTKTVGDGTAFRVELPAALTEAGDDDIVPIPFGTRKKREVNMAIGTFSTRNLPQIPVATANATLAGRLAGLYVQQSGSAPGADGANFFGRGASTFGPNSLRALVDGVLRPFNDIDINEVESITVLKDAASLAWYGLRYGNGVVLVTTRKGSATRSNLQFDVQGGIQVPEKMIRPLNSYDFGRLYNEALVNDGSQPIYDEATLNAYKTGSDLFRFPDNNYGESFLNKQSATQRYVLSADGGSNGVRYFALLSYFNQDGLFKNAKTDDFNANMGFNRFNFRGNVDFDVNKNLTVGLNVAGRSENQRQPGSQEAGTLLSLLYNTPPNAFPIQNRDGSYGGSAQFQNNPLGILRDRGFTSFVTRVLMATIDVREKLDFWVPGLSANINFNYDIQGTYSSGLNRDYQVIDATGANPVIFRNQTPLSYRSAAFGGTAQRNEAWAGFDYDRRFGQHSVKASLKAQRNVSYTPSQLDFRGQGLSSRLDYSFKDRYYFGFVGGYSGSENFPPDKRYGFFPAVSAGWVVSDESFLKPNKLLSYLKLRASYGQAGSSDIGGSRFPFEQFFARNTGGGGYTFGTGFSATTSANEVSIANPNITWETLTTLNAGVDFHLFNHAITGSVDYFINNRRGILTPSAIPSVLGKTLVVNEGEVESKGVDLTLNYEKQLGRLSLSLYGNATITDDRVLAENGQAGLPGYQSTVGRIVGSRFVFVSDGIFQSQAEIDASPRQVLSGRVVPGDIKYKDIGGVNGTPDGIVDNLDRVRIDERDRPKSYFGFGTVARYGIFDMLVHFQGVAGRTIDIQGIVNSGPFNFNQESLNRWTPETAATALYPRLGISDRANNTSASDFWLVPGDYVRLKNVELGATLPKGLLSRYRMKNARVYVGGFNLISFDKLKLDIDPELPGAGRGSTYPYVKTFYAGIRTSF